jgi:predicted transcriptional regulator YheO
MARNNSSKMTADSLISSSDKQLLDMVKPIVDGIAVLFGKNCEALLHSFDNLDRSVIHIVNGHITGRTEGSPITDLGMKVLKESAETSQDVTGCYYSKTTDGKTLRSVTILIRNIEQKPIGMMCINFNMSVPLLELIETFQKPEMEQESPENFVNNIEAMIKTTLYDTMTSIKSLNTIPNHEKNKSIVCELSKRGIFDIRGAVDIVAKELSLSRYTIYNYIRENKYTGK